MKYILQISASLCIGGVEKVARDIGMYADSNKYEVHYVVFNKKIGEYEKELISHGCKIFHLPEPSQSYHNYLKELRIILSETKYDVVHAHTMFNIGWAMMVAKQMKVPVRVAHAHSALNNDESIKIKAYEIFMRYLIHHNATDFVACGEKAGVRLYGKKIYKEKGNLILNGIDINLFRFDIEKRKKIRTYLNIQNNFVIGHVGHLLNVKNQRFLLELMPKVLKKKPNAMLLILGEGPDRQMLEETIDNLHLQNHVIMTGNVPNVFEYLSAMDVLAFPSRYEGMPLSIIEAQANGLPCILSTEVPRDVYLTDLIQSLELSDCNTWVDRICATERKEAEKYAQILRNAGVDILSTMRKIYNIYEGTI